MIKLQVGDVSIEVNTPAEAAEMLISLNKKENYRHGAAKRIKACKRRKSRKKVGHCPICQSEFRREYSGQMFCSKECRELSAERARKNNPRCKKEVKTA